MAIPRAVAAGPDSPICAAALERFRAREGRPLFISEWTRALFIHYEVDQAVLQPEVPFELDLLDGRAFVSLVAFTMRDLRLALPGSRRSRLVRALGRLATAPVATHELLNVRTYVRHEGESGIYFMAEWVPLWLSTLLGPRTYGLPYRLGRLSYEHSDRRARGMVLPARGRGALAYEAEIDSRPLEAATAGSLREHLLERYTAYTMQCSTGRRFRVWHDPWPLARAEVRLIDATALALTGRWHEAARLIGADYSPGVAGVQMSRPRRVVVPTPAGR